jgi:hypothetical protein
MGFSLDIAQQAIGPAPPLEPTPASGVAPRGTAQQNSEQNSADIVGSVATGGTQDGLTLVYDPVDRVIDATNTDKGTVAVAAHEAETDPHPQYGRREGIIPFGLLWHESPEEPMVIPGPRGATGPTGPAGGGGGGSGGSPMLMNEPEPAEDWLWLAGVMPNDAIPLNGTRAATRFRIGGFPAGDQLRWDFFATNGTSGKRWRFHDGSSAMAFGQDMAGIELTAQGMNSSDPGKWTPAIKFGSADSNFSTQTPKFGAVIIGTATEPYAADTDGGMGLNFYTTPDNPGTGGDLSLVLRMDQLQRAIFGGGETVYGITGLTAPDMYHDSLTAGRSGIGFAQWSAGTSGNRMIFMKSRGATRGSHAVLSSSDVIAQLFFASSDGTDFHPAANITCASDGASSAASTPGRLSFQTTPSGSTASQERMRISQDGRVAFLDIHNNPNGAAGTALPYLASGTYTPTLTNQANIASLTSAVCQYIRVGNVVTVTGSVTVDPTTANTFSGFYISIPIASTFTTLTQCSGTAVGVINSAAQLPAGGIRADTVAGNRAICQFTCPASVAANVWSFTFSYLVQ